MDAQAWLVDERRLIMGGDWTPPATRGDRVALSGMTVGAYAARWLRHKAASRRTLESYDYLLSTRLDGTPLADLPISAVTVRDVREWVQQLDKMTPTSAARAYQCVSSMFSAAVEDELLQVNPCRVKGAASVRRARTVVHITGDEVAALTSKMPENLSAAVILAAWAGLRRGEILALDRGDMSEDGSVVAVSKGYTCAGGVAAIGPPKTASSIRRVDVPPHVRAALIEHLATHVRAGQHAPLFADPHTGARITEGALRRAWEPARAEIGRSQLRLHDLRHFAALTSAYAGLTVAETQQRLGHSTPSMALRYQEYVAGRGPLLAQRISAYAAAGTPSTQNS